MPKSLIFTNPGEIDIRGAYIAGMSEKANADTAIGYFGTGLKYAIAQILANGGKITIWSGLSNYTFYAAEMEFRGSTHHQIMMDFNEAGVQGDVASGTIPLGFTTGYGRKWTAWQIFRELYANALDESGNVALADEVEGPSPGRTIIIVNGWEELAAQFHVKDGIILPPTTRYAGDDNNLSVAQRSSDHIYFKGVRVSDRNCLLLWNFKQGVQLTEDRTIEAGSWEISHLVSQFLTHSTSESIIRTVLTADKATFEHTAMAWFNPPRSVEACSTAFAEVVTDLFRQDPVKWSDYEELALEFSPALRESRVVTLTKLQSAMLDKAKSLVARMGYEYEVNNLPITVENLGGKTLGRYKNGAISLSPLVFDQGTKQVVSTLYEECLHAKLGYSDLTYQMQTHLFNTIIGLWEEIMGEPC
jgi:hypothetical protein